MKIVFFGTPRFAVEILKEIHINNYTISAVVTSPDKPAGRGRQITYSAVKEYALAHQLPLLQPENLKSPDFINELKKINADLFVVVAFRMLPELVWKMPPKGTFNLHASLLPQYRGAAPINWAIINGETKTGVTTFFIQHEIDTGNIIFNQDIEILEEDNAGTLHDKLMYAGSKLVIKTIKAIEENSITTRNQNELITDLSRLKHAPKIFKETCKINYNETVLRIHNLIRGLSPYPGAFLELINEKGETNTLKIFESKISSRSNHTKEPGQLITDGKTYLELVCSNGTIKIIDLQLSGKRRMKVEEFLRGYPVIANFRAKF